MMRRIIAAIFALFISLPATAQVISGSPATSGYQPSVYLGQVVTNSQFPNTFNASFQSVQSRTPHITRSRIEAGTRCRLIYANVYYANAAPFETSPGSVASIRAALELPSGAFKQLLFSGVALGSIPNGGMLATDDFIMPEALNDGVTLYDRSLFTNASGIVYVGRGSATGDKSAGLQELGATTTSLTDKTMGGTIGGSGGSNSYSPPVFACDTREVSFLLRGDSRVYGQGDRGDVSYDYGDLARSIGLKYAYSTYAVSGGNMGASAGQRVNLLAIAPYFSHAIVEDGYNDRSGGEAAVGPLYQSLFTQLKGANSALKIYLTTIEPGSTSTVAITVLVSLTTTATATIPTLHAGDLVVGQQIVIAGATPSGYNCTLNQACVITAINGADVSYTLTGGGTGLAAASVTGTLSDIWASRRFQTPVTNEANRVAINTATRAGRAQVETFIDIADFAEPYRNAGIWKFPGWVDDGVHMTHYGNMQVRQSTAVSGIDFTRH